MLVITLFGLVVVPAFLVFVPVVPVTADVPGTGGVYTVTTTQANETSTHILVSDPTFGTGLGSITFCFLGQGALLIPWGYYPLTHVTLQIEGDLCPALRPPT